MAFHALDQITGGANQPGQQNLAGAGAGLLPPNPGTGPVQAPPQIPAGAAPPVSPVAQQQLDPQQQAMQEAAMQADVLYQQQFGESFLQKMQAGQISPQEEAQFTEIIQSVLQGTTTGDQQFAQTRPGAVIGPGSA